MKRDEIIESIKHIGMTMLIYGLEQRHSRHMGYDFQQKTTYIYSVMLRERKCWRYAVAAGIH